MKELLGCAPELLGELDRFVGAVMTPGSGPVADRGVDESGGTSTPMDSSMAASASTPTVDCPETATASTVLATARDLQVVVASANTSQMDAALSTQKARKKKKTSETAQNSKSLSTPAATNTNSALPPLVLNGEPPIQADPLSTSICPDANASALQAEAGLPLSSPRKRKMGHDQASEPATAPAAGAPKTVTVTAKESRAPEETEPARHSLNRSPGAMNVDIEVNVTHAEGDISLSNARKRKRTQTAEESTPVSATATDEPPIPNETTTSQSDSLLSSTNPVVVIATATTESQVGAGDCIPKQKTSPRNNDSLPSPATTTSARTPSTAAKQLSTPNAIIPIAKHLSPSCTIQSSVAAGVDPLPVGSAAPTPNVHERQNEPQVTQALNATSASEELPGPNGQARSTDASVQPRISQSALTANITGPAGTGAFISDVRKRLSASRSNPASSSAARGATPAVNASGVRKERLPARNDPPSSSKSSRATTASAEQGLGLTTPNARKRKIPITEIFAMISPSVSAMLFVPA